MSQIVTRFAPSPTGYLHVGGARTALFNWLLARATGGKYLLRIEDTDLARSTEDAVRQLVEDLSWLGLKWDNPELVYQSKRLHIYNKVIDDLMARDLAYEAWETNEELAAMRDQAAKSKRPFIYRRRQYNADELKKFKDEGRKPIIRFVMPVKEYRFHDVVLGKDVVQPAQESQDFVIRKTDGMPTYHFGVVVDDQDMNVTHVMRGLEHLKNTFNHIALQEALGYNRPTYAHLSVMLNPETGEKLSKRDRDGRIRKRTQEIMRSTKKSVDDMAALTGLSAERLNHWLATPTSQLDLTEQPAVMKVVGLKDSDLPEIMIHDFRRNGYTPDVLLNFLALQGWAPGGDLEQMSVATMVEKFTVDRINASNPKFNRDKLKSFSTDAYSKMTIDEQLKAFRGYLEVNPESPLNAASDAALIKILEMNRGYHILREVDDKSRFLFTQMADLTWDRAAVEKVLLKNDKEGLAALREVKTLLASPDTEGANWTGHNLEGLVKAHAESKGLGMGKVAQPLRVAVTGTAVSPPIFESIELLGRDQTLARIEACIARAE